MRSTPNNSRNGTGLKRENVWDYPRPAVCEKFHGTLTVKHHGEIIANTKQAYRTLETSHPPTYYFPPEDVDIAKLAQNSRQSFCEWKGIASYFDFKLFDETIESVAWAYHSPSESFSAIRHYLSFYASKVDACFVNEEQVIPQAGDFYGGWITSNLEGPFKGEPGTASW